MYYRFLLVIALLSHSTVPGLPENILAFEGGDVILPCSFNITARSNFPNVEWSKEGLKPNVVFLYRDGCETYEMKNPVFEYRTSFILKEMKNGNISLRISNVQLSDSGRYQCMQLWSNDPRHITTVELVVGAVFKPKLSVVSAECGGLTLQCDANYSLSEPEITFLDDQGNELPAEDPKRDKDGNGNHTVRRRMTLHSATNSIICRVHQSEFNLVRDTEILKPADIMRSCCLITVITAGWSILVFIFTCGLAIWFWKRCGNSAERQTLSESRRRQSALSISIESSHLELSGWADNTGNSVTETLKREVAHLKLQLHERNEIICQLLRPGVCQYKQPRIIFSEHISTNTDPPKSATSQTSDSMAAQTNNRRNSSPASLSPTLSHVSSTNSSKKKKYIIGRSLSESYPQPDKKLPKRQRRQSTNNYAILVDVTEESKLLM